MKPKPRDERNLCADLLKLRWRDAAGRYCKEMGILEDISAKGLCLQVEQPIPPGTVLSMIYPGGSYHGCVKYCMLQEARYFVGVQFDTGYRWSKPLYKPPHLLEVPPDPDATEE